VPPSLATTIRTVADVRDAPADAPLVDKSKRTIRRWVTNTASKLQEETDDVGWQYLGAHDLRRTWATALSDADVDPLLVIDWGGWNDLETFLEHYKGAFSPDAHRRERKKVEWL
jgi:integrase